VSRYSHPNGARSGPKVHNRYRQPVETGEGNAYNTVVGTCHARSGKFHHFRTSPRSRLASFTTVRLPLNVDHEYLTVSDIGSPAEAQHVTIYTAAIIQARFAKTAFRLQNRISRSVPSPTVEQIKWCGDQLRDELRPFPPRMQPKSPGPHRLSRAIQFWRSRDFWAVLYRPVESSAAWKATRKPANHPLVQDINEWVVHVYRS